MHLDNHQQKQLIEACINAKQHAYAPYSRFRVGAALLTRQGHLFTGCNVENCSYGGAICAERTALVKAVSEGHRDVVAMAISSDAERIVPCGICRQFMAEFNVNMNVLCAKADGSWTTFTLRDLLPEAFTPEGLQLANPESLPDSI